jgi:hypothetical protein
VPALGLYTSLGFVPEKRLHRFYLNGKDAFRLVLPLCVSEDAASAVSVPGSGNSEHNNKRRLLPVLLPPPPGSSDSDDDEDEDLDEDEEVAGRSAATTGTELPAPASPSSSIGDEKYDYAEDPAKFVRLRRRVAALRACRMITVWPADDDDRVSGR